MSYWVSQTHQHLSFLLLSLLILWCLEIKSQTVIWTNAGTSYTNTDMGIEDNFNNIDVSECTSVRFSMDYSFSLPWSGSPRMESADVCTASGGCAGDPFMPNAGGCDNCWDFMHIELMLDGTIVQTELIGDVGEMRQSGNISWIVCTNEATTLSVRIINQNWAANETNTFSDLQVECWEGYPEFDLAPACQNESVQLNGMAGNSSHVNSWSWSTSGGGTLFDANSQNASGTDISNGDMITLTTTDNNNCTASTDRIITILPVVSASFSYDPFCGNTGNGAYNFNTGGTFSFDPDPGNGASIDPITGVINNAAPGTYFVKYELSGTCPDESIVQVDVTAPDDASFNFDDFCEGSVNGPDNIATPGGTFEFDPNPGDGATIDPSTGEISNGTGGATYTVRYTTSGSCPGTFTETVTVIASPIPSFDFDDFCVGGNNGPTNISPAGGTFSFANPPGDGATIDPNTGVISNSTDNTYEVLYTTSGSCPGTAQVSVTAQEGPAGTLSGDAILCPGQCETFSFSFTSGSEPYTINLTASPPGIALPAIPGVSASQVFTICYGGSGLFPSFDPSTFTINIPTIFSGSGSLILTGISDGSGCPGSASGSFSLTLTSAPTANAAGPLTVCADIDGNGTFDLTSLDNTVSGGNGSLTVEWFEDMDATQPISNPSAYVSMGGTVYVRVNNGTCPSATIPVDLIVETGDVPFISMLCAESGTDNCTLCLSNNQINLAFLFGDNNTYVVTVRDDNTGLEYSGQVSNIIPLTVSSSTSTTFTLMNIQPLAGCPNFATYSDVVTVDIVLSPEIDPITIAPSCLPVTLPPITGNNLSGNESYYTGPNGTGTPLIPGTEILSSQTLYIYDSSGGCEDEIIIAIIITPLIVFDDIMDMDDCVEIVLPTIIGTGVSGNSFFSDMPDGTGNIYDPGDVIDFNTTLYVIDPDADPNCIGNSVSFEITIHGHPEDPTFTVDCSGNTATITVTNLPLTDHSVSLNGVDFQSNNVFTNIPNGVYTLTIINDITGCESEPITVDVNCGCDMPAILTLPRLRDSICFVQPGVLFTLANILFESPTQVVTVTSNGAGTLYGTIFSRSPSTFSYLVHPSDNGRDIDFVFTTNDPDGPGPCTPTVRTFRLTVLSGPAGIITGPSEVCTGQDLELTASGGQNYIWQDGSDDNPRIFQNILNDTTLSVTVIDAFGCRDTTFRAISIREVSAGGDSSARFCLSALGNIDLNSYLSPAATRGGIWQYNNDTITDPEQFSVSGFSTGDYLLFYIINDTICGADTSALEIKITPGNNAGMDNYSAVCENSGEVNLNPLLGIHDTGGLWRQLSVGSPAINIMGIVDVTGAIPGQYTYHYLIPENGCDSDTASIVLDIKEYRDLGPFTAITRCTGSMVDLRDIFRETVLSGTILNPNNHSGLVGPIWNTTGLPAGTYTFEYLINNEWPCPNDLEILTIILQENLNPGSGSSVLICGGQNLDLRTLLSSDADPGGRFIYQGQEISGGLFTPLPGTTIYNIEYQVGDGVTCPVQNATFIIELESEPNVDMMQAQDICENECQDILINHSSPQGSIFYFSIQNSDGTFIEQSDTVQLLQGNPLRLTFCSDPGNLSFSNLPNENTLTLAVDSIVSPAGCSYAFPDIAIINTFPLNQKSINPIICSHEEFGLGGSVFNISNPSGSVLIPAVMSSGCDTVMNVNLNFYPEATSTFKAIYCDQNANITIGNEVFDITRPEGSVVLSGASSQGCDSTVNVLLTFNPTVVPGTFIYSTCNKNYSYTVGVDTFNFLKPSGTVLLSGEAVGGCDSLVNVSIDYTDFDVSYDIEPSCENEPALITLTSATHIGPYRILYKGSDIGSTQNVPYSFPLLPNDYNIMVVNAEGCTDTLELSVPSIPAPEVILSQIRNPDGQIQIMTSSAPDILTQWSWSPQQGLSCTDCPDPIANPVETTTYILTYGYGNNCMGEERITVRRNTGKVIFPNIIHLNSGINNTFYTTLPEGVTGTIPVIRIYDRWGNKIFERFNARPNDPEDGWSGKFNGRSVQNGVYMYYVEILWDGQSSPDVYAGDITVTE